MPLQPRFGGLVDFRDSFVWRSPWALQNARSGMLATEISSSLLQNTSIGYAAVISFHRSQIVPADWHLRRLSRLAGRRPSGFQRRVSQVATTQPLCHMCGYHRGMGTVSIRELANNVSAVIDEVAASGRPAVVTKHGKPVAALVPIDQDALEDWVLANAPEYVANMAQADKEIASGERGTPLDDVLAELDA